MRFIGKVKITMKLKRINDVTTTIVAYLSIGIRVNKTINIVV